jgi:SOS response regulatory protein OraA/RecX
MRRLGIEAAVATAVLDAEYPEAREVEVAVAFVRRRFPPEEAAPDARERVVRLLLGRGFGGRARSAAAAVLPTSSGPRGARRPPDLDELRRLLRRRYPAHAADPAERRRALSFLARRGVRGDDARRLLDGRDARR